MARPKHKNPLKYVNWKIVRFLEKQSYNLDSTRHFNPKEYCTKIDERLTQLKKFRRCVCLANYHFVFVTKGRCRVFFPECRTLVKIKIEQICREFNFDVLALEVMPEHIHLFVSLNQKIAPCKFWHLIRYNLQIFLYETCPILQKALSRDILQRSYYFGTIGNVTGFGILKYVSRQWEEFDRERYFFSKKYFQTKSLKEYF